MDTESCFVCSKKLEHFGKRSGYDYFKCKDCGTIQLTPLPSEEELALLYAKEYSKSGHESISPSESKAIKKQLWGDIKRAVEKYSPNGKILDYGAGWGGLCELLISNRIQCEAVDKSEEMVTYCRKTGIPITLGDLNSFPDKTFDAIVMCTVFEHLVKHDDFLNLAHNKLKDDGFFISVQPTAHFASFAGTIFKNAGELPDLNGAFSPPWHTSLISCKGMLKLTEQNGFQTVEVTMAPNTRRKGLLGLFLRFIELVNRIAWPIFRDRWPLVICHTFVLKKVKV